MTWVATQIGWDQQVMLMGLLLTPIFIVCGLLAFAAPVLYPEAKSSQAQGGSTGDVARAGGGA